MPTVKIRFQGFTAILYVFLLIFAGCGGTGGGGGATADTTAPVSAQSQTVAFGDAGTLRFPAGSLAAGADVKVSEAVLPVLGSDLTALGSAWHISVETKPGVPVEVSLPVPDGEAPAGLMLVRQEDSGRLTLLQTRLENGMLKALTPGFSSVFAARLKELLNGFQPEISGPDFLPVSMSGQYIEINMAHQTGLLRQWRVFEDTPGIGARIDFSGNPLDQSNVRLSAEHPGSLTLMVEFTEPVTGLNAFAYKSVSILESFDSGAGLDINITGSNTVMPGDTAKLNAVVLNTDVTGMKSWSWEFGDQSGGCAADCTAVLSISTTELAPLAANERRTFKVTGTSMSGVVGSAQMEVRAESSSIVFLGFEPVGSVVWDPLINSHPEVELKAQIFGGTPPYNWHWQIRPVPGSFLHNIDTTTDTYKFNVAEPGDFKAMVTVTDSGNNTVDGDFFFDVKTTQPLKYELLNVPAADIVAGRPFTVKLRVRGGTIVYRGERYTHYNYIFVWADPQVSSSVLFKDSTMAVSNVNDGGSADITLSLTTPGKHELLYVAQPERGVPANLFASPKSAYGSAIVNVVAPQIFVPPVSNFDNTSNNAEGWQIGPRSSVVEWHNCTSAEQRATGGNPDGFLTHTEICGNPLIFNDGWYFIAPGKFYGDMTAAFGHNLGFDLRSNGHLNPVYPFHTQSLIVLHGAGKYVYLPTLPAGAGGYVKPHDSAWTHYSFPLSTGDAAHVWWESESGLLNPSRKATDADMKDVLTGLDRLSIFGDFDTGATDLDNVILGAN